MAAYGQSYWTRRETTPRKSRATLKGAVTTDVVVIGGGLTGCATAFVLAKAGLKVILLEQHTIASGATSRGMGLVLPTLDVSFGQAMKEAGARPAKVTAAELRRSAREFAATLACWSTRRSPMTRRCSRRMLPSAKRRVLTARG
jgi:glycine/D-amino acid oxidase-like deaminating enzyme